MITDVAPGADEMTAHDMAPEPTGQTMPVEPFAHPSRAHFRASRRKQAERRRRFVALPLVLLGLGMVSAGVWKFTHDDDSTVETPAQVNGTQVTNTSPDSSDVTSDLSSDPDSDTSVDVTDDGAVPVVPPIDDPSGQSTTTAASSPVEVIPPASISKPTTTTTAKPRPKKRRIVTTTTAAGGVTTTAVTPTTAATATTAKPKA